uniref:Uncharacterized protein n=1 Tax=Oryza punctata TaxID=4537 RepID=A0A0E0LTA6_ORYPU
MAVDYGELPEASHRAFEGHLEDLRRRMLNSLFLGGASISYNSKCMYGVSSTYNIPLVPITIRLADEKKYLQFSQYDPKFILQHSTLVRQVVAVDHTTATLPVRPDVVASHITTGKSFRIGYYIGRS